jgi:hypothetical protein
MAAVLMGCGTHAVTNGSVIDGWTVGEVWTCTETDRERPCSAMLPFAQKRLDQRDPGHLAVVASQLRLEGNRTIVRSGVLYLAVFTLSDGSRKAIAVTYPGVATYLWTRDYGP